MTHRIKEQAGDFIRLEAREVLRAQDYEGVLPAVEKQIQANGLLRAILDLRGLEEIEPAAWAADIRLDKELRGEFTRCAVIGDRSWAWMVTRLAAPTFSGDIRFFDAENAEESSVWIAS